MARERNQDIYMKLAELYRRLGDMDVVLSLYVKATEHAETQRALEAEMCGRMNEAQKILQQRIDGFDGAASGVSPAEVDLWFDENMKCLRSLAKWGDLMDRVEADMGGLHC